MFQFASDRANGRFRRCLLHGADKRGVLHEVGAATHQRRGTYRKHLTLALHGNSDGLEQGSIHRRGLTRDGALAHFVDPAAEVIGKEGLGGGVIAAYCLILRLENTLVDHFTASLQQKM